MVCVNKDLNGPTEGCNKLPRDPTGVTKGHQSCRMTISHILHIPSTMWVADYPTGAPECKNGCRSRPQVGKLWSKTWMEHMSFLQLQPMAGTTGNVAGVNRILHVSNVGHGCWWNLSLFWQPPIFQRFLVPFSILSLPSGHQTWLAGKSTICRWFSRL